MKKRVLIPLIVFGSLTLCVGANMAISAIVNKVYEDTKEYDFSGQVIQNLEFDLHTSDLEFIKTNDLTQKVVCKETTKRRHKVSLDNGTLKVKHEKRRFVDYVLMLSPQFKVSVYLPATNYDSLSIDISTGDTSIPSGFNFSSLDYFGSTGNVSVKSNVVNTTNVTVSTGNISLHDMSTKELNLTASTGRVYISNINVLGESKITTTTGRATIKNLKTNSLTMTASTGDIKINDSLVAKNAFIHASTGEINFIDSDAETLDLKTSTGDIKAVFLSPKTLDIDSGGRVRTTGCGSGGKCKIATSTGDVTISVKS